MDEPSRLRYLAWLVSSTPSSVRKWVPDQRLLVDLATYLDHTWQERTENVEWLAGYAETCPIARARPNDYRLREINVSSTVLLAGIHFRNRDVNQPFVGVFAQARELTGSEISAATRSLIADFELFEPTGVRWWSPEQHDLRSVPSAQGDYRLVIGPIADIVHGCASLPSQYSFRPERVAQFYDDYRYAYAEFRSVASFDNVPAPESPASLEDCERNGVLYCLREAGRFAGLMAARPRLLRGIRGWEIVEEIVGADHRGRRFASAMQRFFVSKFDPALGTLVMGEIADGNLPSLRTAQRAGRRDVGGWVFIRA
jgi:hypothetical protein